MIILEGILPFLWLPVWLYFISDHPRYARWISVEERGYLETTLKRESGELETVHSVSIWRAFLQPAVFVMMIIYFLQNCAAYGCMTFFTEDLKGAGARPTGLRYGILLGIPYLITSVLMILNSRHSDKTRERRAHVAGPYLMSGVCLI